MLTMAVFISDWGAVAGGSESDWELAPSPSSSSRSTSSAISTMSLISARVSVVIKYALFVDTER